MKKEIPFNETERSAHAGNETTALTIYGDYGTHFDKIKEDMRRVFPESVKDVDIIGVEIAGEIEYDNPIKAYMRIAVLLLVNLGGAREKLAVRCKRLVDGITTYELNDWLDVVVLEELSLKYDPKYTETPEDDYGDAD